MSDDQCPGIATLRFPHEDAATIAAAIKPDDTDEIDTSVETGVVVTTVERESISGLRSTLDDVLVNLDVAAKTAQLSDRNPNSTTNE